MIDFILKKVSDNSPHYNLTFIKEVHKRSGEIVKEPCDTIYTISLTDVKNRISHMETAIKLGDIDVSLNEYLFKFRESYKEVCESLKTIL